MHSILNKIFIGISSVAIAVTGFFHQPVKQKPVVQPVVKLEEKAAVNITAASLKSENIKLDIPKKQTVVKQKEEVKIKPTMSPEVVSEAVIAPAIIVKDVAQEKKELSNTAEKLIVSISKFIEDVDSVRNHFRIYGQLNSTDYPRTYDAIANYNSMLNEYVRKVSSINSGLVTVKKNFDVYPYSYKDNSFDFNTKSLNDYAASLKTNLNNYYSNVDTSVIDEQLANVYSADKIALEAKIKLLADQLERELKLLDQQKQQYPITSDAQGGCSWHGGIDYSAGPDWDGSFICNDGWRNSSVRYQPQAQTYCMTELQKRQERGVFEGQLARSGGGFSSTPVLTESGQIIYKTELDYFNDYLNSIPTCN